MVKRNVLAFLTCTIAISLLKTSGISGSAPEAGGEQSQESFEDPERRSAAFASAHASAGPGPRPNFNPGPKPLALVECYVCTDCPKVYPNTTTKICPASFDKSKSRGCVSYSEQYQHMKKAWHIRGCTTERGTCREIEQAHSLHAGIVKLLQCNDCEGDRCNSAVRSLSDLTTAFVVLVVVPLIGKCTFS